VIEIKHTPGPWVRNPESTREAAWSVSTDTLLGSIGGETWIVLGNESDPVPVCIVTEIYAAERDEKNDYPRLEANARLIAAAPQMFAALKTIIEASDKCMGHRWCRHDMTGWKMAREVIAEVEEETP
jgi:hypothetical protein